MNWRHLGIAAVLLSVACSGGAPRPKTVPVSGTLMAKGEPVEGAKVVFMGEGSPRAASGTTDANGKFRLTTFSPFDGAVLGKHMVSVSVPPPDSESVDPSELDPNDPGEAYSRMMNEAAAPKKEATDSVIPAKYGDPKSSGLTFTVTAEGPNEFPIMIE